MSDVYKKLSLLYGGPKVPMKTKPLNNRRVQGGQHILAVGFSIHAVKRAELAQ